MKEPLTIRLDPPLSIPPFGRATVEGSCDGNEVTVRVWDKHGRCVADGVYVRMENGRHKFVRGNILKPEGAR